MSVKVGVRVRPFNGREKELNCKLCVDMVGVTTKLLDLQDPTKNRPFAFDYSFWSHDEFSVDEKGYFVGDSPKYADQQKVYESVGVQILDNAWQGYHCCLFAYGQTGAGKSYSMVGYGVNKGIVPISCEQIFNRIRKNQNKNKEYQVDVSMLEIYNERVQDLLIPINKRPKEGLKIRQHKTLGVYVQGLTKYLVDSYEAIEAKMDQGSRNRSVAATDMNANSSRAHTIISIEFRQREIINDKKVEKLSVIYLVDLAGSQKVGKTGATGDRLKEAAGINKSLSVLGLVISTLADKASGKGKNTIVPYRDSCLTRILQNALGGNSKTLMICAISPATDNYEQTLSTLRYADQAKKIQNKAIVNESETDKMIRELTQENQKLKKFMEMFSKMGINVNDEATIQKFNDAKADLSINNALINNSSMSKQDKIKQQQVQRPKQSEDYVKVDKSKPHLSNLNEDPFLSRKINYSLDKQIIRIGKKNAEVKNDIQISALGMKSLLATITRQDDKYFLNTFVQEISNNQNIVYINGVEVTEKIEVKNNDRLKFGINSIFLIILPGGQENPRENPNKQIDWEYAQQQLYLLKQKIEIQKKQEERKIKNEEERKLQEKQQELAEIKKRQQQNEIKMKEMTEKMQNQIAELQEKRKDEQRRIAQQLHALRLQKEIQNDKKKIKDEQNQRKAKIKQKYYFQNKLMKTLPKVIEINLIAKEFKRNISMSVKMLLFDADVDVTKNQTNQKMNIKIQIDNREKGYKYFWDLAKFSNRYYIIKDMIDKYYQTGKIPELPQNQDPFWDPPEPILIGKSFMTFKGLVYLFDNPTNLAIIGQNHQCGELKVNLIPTDEGGKVNLSQQVDQQMEFEPEDLIGKPFYFNIIIESAKIPENFESVYVEYTIKINDTDKETYKTEQIKQQTKSPIWNYCKTHNYSSITDETLNYLQTTNLIFKIFGIEILKVPEKKVQKKANGLQPDQIQAKINDEKRNTVPAIQLPNGNLTNPQAQKPKESIQTKKPTTVKRAENKANVSAANDALKKKQAKVLTQKQKEKQKDKKKTGKQDQKCLIF